VPNLVVWVLFLICANLSSGFRLSILIVNFVKCHTSCRQKEDEYWFRYTCPGADSITGVGYYNDLATLFFSVPHQSIQRLLALGSTVDSYFTVQSLCIHWMSFLGLFILAYGIATPGGISMPSIMVRAHTVEKSISFLDAFFQYCSTIHNNKQSRLGF
jgi:hypothetical protein